MDLARGIGRHHNPVMPDDRRDNDVLNAARDGAPDFGKLRRFPHDADSVRGDDPNGQMEKPMQIAEPHVQHEEDQVIFYAFVCSLLQK